MGRHTFTMLHTPGHTRGSVCLAGEGSVFTGDVLFQGSIGRFDFPGSSGPDLMRSIRDHLMTLPPETAVYPGHGPATTIEDERRYNPFLVNPRAPPSASRSTSPRSTAGNRETAPRKRGRLVTSRGRLPRL